MVELFSQSMALFGLGLVLGLQHALDADHVVAVSTLVSETKSLKKSSLLGVFWGLGHTSTLFVTGVIVLAFKWSIPNQVSLSLEFLVGILLVLLGADVIRKILKERVHLHKHEHEDGIVHIHLHSHKTMASHHHTHKSFFIGIIHGLAGSAALVLLVLATVETMFQGILFLLFFGIGSIIGMLATSLIIALPFKFMSNINGFNKFLKAFVGLTSIVVGFVVMYKVGFAFMELNNHV